MHASSNHVIFLMPGKKKNTSISLGTVGPPIQESLNNMVLSLSSAN